MMERDEEGGNTDCIFFFRIKVEKPHNKSHNFWGGIGTYYIAIADKSIKLVQ